MQIDRDFYNSLLAEFAGAERQQWYLPSEMYNQSGVHYSFPKEAYSGYEKYHCVEHLKYDTDRNWLLSIVDKVESLGYDVLISTRGVQIWKRNISPDATDLIMDDDDGEAVGEDKWHRLWVVLGLFVENLQKSK